MSAPRPKVEVFSSSVHGDACIIIVCGDRSHLAWAKHLLMTAATIGICARKPKMRPEPHSNATCNGKAGAVETCLTETAHVPSPSGESLHMHIPPLDPAHLP